MDPTRVALLREALQGTSWFADARVLGRSMRRTGGPGGLVLVGTPDYEPWHLTAHLDDESRLAGVPQLAPTLARWSVPDGAPPHLAVTLRRLEVAGRGETLLVVTPDDAPESLLDRASDAKRRGATVLSVDGGDDDLGGLAHERMVVHPSGLVVPPSVDLGGAPETGLSFDVAQHLVSAAAAEDDPSTVAGRRGWRTRLDRLLESVSGPVDR